MEKEAKTRKTKEEGAGGLSGGGGGLFQDLILSLNGWMTLE